MEVLITRTANYAYLKHHGILGQKWGKKNGPPYPLGASDHSTSEKKAGWRKSLDKDSSDNDNKKRGLSDKQKKAIKIGATVAVTALAAYGTYRLVKSGKLDNYIDIGKSKTETLLKKKAGDTKIGDQKVDNLLKNASTAKTASNGVKKLSKPETLADTIMNVNPNRGNSAYDNNCTLCSTGSILRQVFGMDITAGSTGRKPQNLGGIVEECFEGAKIIDGSAVKFGKSKQDASEMLIKRFGDNASGVVSVEWKRGGGHAFNWQIKDGTVSFYDGQANRDDSVVSKYWQMINQNGSLILARLDNAKVKEEGIRKWFEFAK